MRILVLGIGNLLLGDEAVGVRIVEALEQRYRLPAHVELLDGGTSGMELMEMMADRDHLIVADAVLTGAKPGSVAVLYDEEIPALFTRKVSPHQLGLSDVLMALRLTDEFPRRLTLVGVVPESLEPGIGLSAVVSQAIEPALAQVLLGLQESGVVAEPKEVANADCD
ncbi:HyaD/HybD family hydrogenase maturation endopeptidase [Serratia fonticola]|jgi:hydrogenase maturation protease|uniref:HyaD/HybD family hydrogenase maturation endopeptidase n=1 Tax=Serratia fonticola TaxID=47917 RepID=UPI0003AF1530|nr:HyaD/HybD family hydrogenase maturation endopeptidase [Serratia fonticola]ERK16050.1 Hydrogenase maturation protease [Serratia fonticola AU-AP2C]MBP0995745.1 HyaD/HybD family hydrogenase maturation endopeptidase [Serratia fonticola]MBP1000837.1 HyaD/HybD family hydrogenase maturation endopeptidase [Serratia fonticola]MBP1010606.1 HyaD/HybD family hydrogenase maturation endopeptidase [Serratia fonticola]MBP1035014.1 HyaD/HybD family hydrogenase maturation endopeptidase [Serratia fonticola]